MSKRQNLFCALSNLSNEASVETWFVNPLLAFLGYVPEEILVKTSINEIKIGSGSRSGYYKPDYIVRLKRQPRFIVDAKSTSEEIEDWTQQCSSYALELNKRFDHNPTRYYIVTNGVRTGLYHWDMLDPILTLAFEDFVECNHKLVQFKAILQKDNLLREIAGEVATNENEFVLEKIPLDELSKKFDTMLTNIYSEEKKTPSEAFPELLKIIFVKLQKDKEIHTRFGAFPHPKREDVVFSVHWIKNQSQSESPISDILFKNLITGLEKEIQAKKKKRFFDASTYVDLSASAIEKVVEELEHVDLFGMDEDVHGRMFENFLDATVRGKELGQYFTPRDIVQLMVDLADLRVDTKHTDSVLDACCGSGGFLITAMSKLISDAKQLAGITEKQLEEKIEEIQTARIFGIDAGSAPAIYEIARMNMYLHGDGGSNIFFADSLDKSLGKIGRSDVENEAQLKELRKIIITERKKFDVILSNPPFSMTHSMKKKGQRKILEAYDLTYLKGKKNPKKTLLSSVMFLERYKDLAEPDGKILAIIDDSVLSGGAYQDIRKYIRDNFIIKAIISLPGDAFKRAAARVKTSILILKIKEEGENQPYIFMAKSVYLGLTKKTAKRISIQGKELDEGKRRELALIPQQYKLFLSGTRSASVVPATRIHDRMDVKYCLNDNGRKKGLWIKKGFEVASLDNVLKTARGRVAKVDAETSYDLLKVNYGGIILDAETKLGDECSYSKLYQVKTWDVVFSNMGVGRGAIGIVPPYQSDKFVSNEYTILKAESKEEALFYVYLLRTKEILGDILSSTTGMNRGRIKWNAMKDVQIPKYDKSLSNLTNNVKMIEKEWKSFMELREFQQESKHFVSSELDLDGIDARLRWLALKPPE